MVGPILGANNRGMPIIPVARGSSFLSKVFLTIDKANGMIIPPPIACKIRKEINDLMLHASALELEPIVKTTRLIK